MCKRLPQHIAVSVKEVARLLSNKRVDMGLTQQQVAEAIGATKKQVSDIERFRGIEQDETGCLKVSTHFWEMFQHLDVDDTPLALVSKQCEEYSIALVKENPEKVVYGLVRKIRKGFESKTLRASWFDSAVISVYLRRTYVGSKLLCLNDDMATCPEFTLTIANVIVVSGARGNGLYSALLRQLEVLAKEKSYGLRVECAQQQHARIYSARGFYRRDCDWFKRC